MRSTWVAGVFGLSLLALGLSTSESWALRIAMPVGPEPLVQARYVVTGTVTSVEEREVELPAAPNGGGTVKYKVAVIKVGETIKGANRNETIRVAFLATAAPVKGPIRRPPLTRAPELKAGQEGLFFLNKHFKETVYLPVDFQGVVLRDPNGQAFANELAQVKLKQKLLQAPLESLRSKDAKDRVQTAALLLGTYRGTFAAKTEPISPDESKLILTALLDANWTTNQFDTLGGQYLFNKLGVTQKDGWTPPMNFQQFPEAAQQWLRQNAATFRIQRYVPMVAEER